MGNIWHVDAQPRALLLARAIAIRRFLLLFLAFEIVRTVRRLAEAGCEEGAEAHAYTCEYDAVRLDALFAARFITEDECDVAHRITDAPEIALQSIEREMEDW